jgi:hypothetical protein
MDFEDVFDDINPQNSLIQNRLTVTGFALTVLIFSGGFTLGLFNSFPQELRGIYHSDFLHIEVSLSLGVTSSVLALMCFLLAQQARAIPKDSPSGTVLWLLSKQWWFSVGQILLYLTLTQALSAALTEVVYGAGQSSPALGLLLGIVALPVWLFLLFLGPVSYIWRFGWILTRSGLIALTALYGMFLIVALGLNAEAYRLHSGDPFTVLTFVVRVLYQLIQPLTWHQPW